MTTYDRADIMRRAWRSYRQGHLPFAHHLRRVWRCAKAERAIETYSAPTPRTGIAVQPVLTGAAIQRLVRPLTKGWA
jgi:hypothetical protein